MLAPDPTLGLTPTRTASGVPTGRPLHGVFETLADQHRQLLESLRDAGAVDDAARRQECWSEVRRRLLSHERAEAQVVYAPLEQHDAGRKILAQHAAQAAELETMVEELDAVDVESDAWIERLRDLMAMIDDHVRDEESGFFQIAQKILGERASADLRETYDNSQREILHALT